MNNKQKLELLVREINIYTSHNKDYLVGRLLTMIEAAIADPEQRKALKDLVRNEVYSVGSINDPGAESRQQTLIRQYAESEGVAIFPEYNSPRGEVWNPFDPKNKVTNK